MTTKALYLSILLFDKIETLILTPVRAQLSKPVKRREMSKDLKKLKSFLLKKQKWLETIRKGKSLFKKGRSLRKRNQEDTLRSRKW